MRPDGDGGQLPSQDTRLYSPRYNCNIVESGVKHHNPNPLESINYITI
jgi:hypothetical protein